jgi:hypothetical protein
MTVFDDPNLLRDGAMETLFDGVRAPSTLKSHLRSYYLGQRPPAG